MYVFAFLIFKWHCKPLMVSLWLGGGHEFWINLITLIWVSRGCLCLAERAHSLPEQCQEQRYGCVSQRARSRSVQECHLGSCVGKRQQHPFHMGFEQLRGCPWHLWAHAWTVCQAQHSSHHTHPAPGIYCGTCKVGMGSCLLLGLLSTVGMSKPLQMVPFGLT